MSSALVEGLVAFVKIGTNATLGTYLGKGQQPVSKP
jgi:hypothetical protein